MGRLGSIGDAASGVRRIRKRTLRRWVGPGLAAVALVASLVTVVRRGEQGRRLSGEVAALEAEAQVAADRIVEERARVDSLTAPARIEEVAASIGLRRARDEELRQVEAAPPE